MADAVDPFATVEKTGTTKAKTTKAKVEPIGMEELLAYVGEMTLEEEDFAPPAPIMTRYIKPAEHTWVPVTITDVKVEQREQKAVVAYTADGTMVYNPVMIDKLVSEHGAEQSVESVTLYQFVVEAEHLADCYGERSSSYRLYTPVFPMRIPLNKPRTRNGVTEMGFDKNSGKKLLAATRVLKPGVRLKEDENIEETLTKLAEEMVGRNIMARIRHRVKKSDDSIPRKNQDGSPVKALVDNDGSFVRLARKGENLIYSTGEIYEGETTHLISFDNGFLIPDDSDDAATVRDTVKREVTYDNLADDVYGLPGRTITVQDSEGAEFEAEVTWNTLGNVAVQPIKAGTMVQGVIQGEERQNTLITASWLGTHWAESEVPHELQVSDPGGVMSLVSVDLLTGGTDAGLDMFKGDPA